MLIRPDVDLHQTLDIGHCCAKMSLHAPFFPVINDIYVSSVLHFKESFHEGVAHLELGVGSL